MTDELPFMWERMFSGKVPMSISTLLIKEGVWYTFTPPPPGCTAPRLFHTQEEILKILGDSEPFVVGEYIIAKYVTGLIQIVRRDTETTVDDVRGWLRDDE